ncbi:ankyrin repeat domain-containing protein [Bacteroidota bacterium]
MRECLNIVLFLFGFLSLLSQESGDLGYELMLAAEAGDSTRIIELLDSGAYVDASTYEGITPLMYACENGHYLTAKILILNGADVNAEPSNSLSPLFCTSRIGNWKIGELLIQNGAEVDKEDWWEATPLLYASAYDNFYTTDMLLYYNANIEHQDYEGTNALMAAVKYNCYDIVDLLIEKGANINSKDKSGLTPLMIASQTGDSAMIELLMEKGSSIKQSDNNNMTAFTHAAMQGNLKACKVLHKHGADINKNIPFAKNPLYFSQKSRNKKLTKFLIENGAKRNYIPYIDQIIIGTDITFNNNDFLYGLNFGFHEGKYNFILLLSYEFRPWERRVLVNNGENNYYQFWERRNNISIEIEKHINIYRQSNIKSFGLNIGVKNVLSNAKYLGSSVKPGTNFIVSPRLGLYRSGKYSTISLNYEFTDYDIYRFNKNWISLSFDFPIIIDKQQKSFKTIPWY